ncbi:MAG TPA: SCP2 sterol-binding domain-containing protein [Candidatus Nanopelagicaceae bacterium]|jgi:putative sterol carrier protein|nr:SCP2 sterol-binding domain-containing protein [Candidatus Nanopelagicaceae bacterium]
MVDQNLINKLKEMREKGASKPSDSLNMYEFVKQMAEESEDLKEELEDIDTMMVQLVITDANYKYWVKLGDGTVDYGEGDGEDPSVTMSATGATWSGLSSGEIDSTSAYMSGDLVIDGNLQDAIAYGEILSIAMEEGAKYFED